MKTTTLAVTGILLCATLAACRGAEGEEGAITDENGVSALSSPAVYTNTEGCRVTLEPRARQVSVLVEKGTTWAAFGYRPDLSSADITAFCDSAVAKQDGDILSISCGDEDRDGIPTRGKATMELAGALSAATAGTLKAVTVVGEKKGWFRWSKDTDMSCKNLRLSR